MMIRNGISIVATVLSLGLAAAAQAEVFEYAKQLHAVDQQGCETQGQELAARAARLSGGTVKSIYCSELRYQYFDVSVFIEVAKKPALELAVYAFNVIEAPSRSNAINRGYIVLDVETAFPNISACLASLPTLEAQFAEVTGLEPVSSQCIKESQYSFIAQVDAFGTGARHLLELNISLYNSEASDQLTAQVSNYMRDQGVLPVYNGSAHTNLKVKYFAESHLKLRGFDFRDRNQFKTEAECQKTAATISAVLATRSDLKLAGMDCNLGQWAGGVKFFVLASVMDISGQSNESIPLTISTLGRYSSFEACENARGSVTGAYCSISINDSGTNSGYELNSIQ